ncbi:uncharacterized protein LOC131608161 [Vicia villosa]|uniref:uncharacterized protein LOC131608161 n=1 Tax=Vicia villosa TaxID=3911 RepID=UPI00273B4133|nr:uncharacterized protein LOC131608161 [Vicia villosa]
MIYFYSVQNEWLSQVTMTMLLLSNYICRCSIIGVLLIGSGNLWRKKDRSLPKQYDSKIVDEFSRVTARFLLFSKSCLVTSEEVLLEFIETVKSFKETGPKADAIWLLQHWRVLDVCYLQNQRCIPTRVIRLMRA